MKAPEKPKDSVVEKEKQKTSARNNKSKEIGQNEVQKRTRRNKGTTEEAGTSDTMKKSEILAKKLLAKKMVKYGFTVLYQKSDLKFIYSQNPKILDSTCTKN